MGTPTPHLLCGHLLFCDSVAIATKWDVDRHRFYPNVPLWDGQVCEGDGSCCQLNNPPWFTKNLTTPTTDGIELQFCLAGCETQSNIGLELVELYIQ